MRHYFFWMLLASIYFSCGPSDIQHIRIKGSDTEVNLALRLAETYMAVNDSVSIAVTGGGSGMGIAALLNGKTNLANSSRPLQPKERELAKERGIDIITTRFAVDALALVVHPSLPLDTLSLNQLARIFDGTHRNWSELGGPDRSISTYGRQSSSGTFIYFRESIVKGEYSPDMKQLNGTAQIIESVRQDPGAIGYVGIGYAVDKQGKTSAGLKLLNISTDHLAYSPLDKQAIRSGEYPITRPLYQFSDGIPKGALRRFIEYELSPAGQRMVEESGYFPLTAKLLAKNRWMYE